MFGRVILLPIPGGTGNLLFHDSRVEDCSFLISSMGGPDKGHMREVTLLSDPRSRTPTTYWNLAPDPREGLGDISSYQPRGLKVPWGYRFPVMVLWAASRDFVADLEHLVWWFGYGYCSRDQRSKDGTLEIELEGLHEYLKGIYPGSEQMPLPTDLKEKIDDPSVTPREPDFPFFGGICFAQMVGDLWERYEGHIKKFSYPTQLWPPNIPKEFQKQIRGGELEIIEDAFLAPMLVVRVKTWGDVFRVLIDYYVARPGGIPVFPYFPDPRLKNFGKFLSIHILQIGPNLDTKLLPSEFQVLKMDGSLSLWEIMQSLVILNDTNFFIHSVIKEGSPERGVSSVVNYFVIPDDRGAWGPQVKPPMKAFLDWAFKTEMVSEFREEMAIDSLINSVTIVPSEEKIRGSSPGRNWIWKPTTEDLISVRLWGKKELVVDCPILTEGQIDAGKRLANQILTKWGLDSNGEVRSRGIIKVPRWPCAIRPYPYISQAGVPGLFGATASGSDGKADKLEKVRKVFVDFNEGPSVELTCGAPEDFVSLLATRFGSRFGLPRKHSEGKHEGEGIQDGLEADYQSGDDHTEEVEEEAP